MRQTLNALRFLTLLAAVAVVLPAGRVQAAEGESVTVRIQGVLATREKDQLVPKVAPSLQAYVGILKRFGFDKYDDIGSGSGVVKAGQATAIKVGSHTIEATLIEIDKGTARIKYTVKDPQGAAIGSNAMALAPGQIAPIQIGDPAFPIILLFQAGR